MFKKAINELKLYAPVAKTTCLAIVTFVITAGLQIFQDPTNHIIQPWLLVKYLPLFVAGFCYSLFIEYAHHRLILHKEFKGWLKIFAEDHVDHHNIFKGANFQTRDLDKLQKIAPYWPTFPLIFLIHYVILITVTYFFGISAIGVLIFLAGITTEFIYFEVTHFALHVEDSFLNGTINSKIKIQRHRIHHQLFNGYFGVSVGWFDKWFATAKRRQ